MPKGSVVELASAGAAGATRIALAACRAAQQEALARGGAAPWCAFVDSSKTLHGPGVAEAGVVLERLLVVQPSWESIGRVATRLVESHVFSVVVIDTLGVPGCAGSVSLGAWPRIVRRLSLAASESSSLVLLVTDNEAKRSLPLPVALRLELKRPKNDELVVRVAKDKRGRISGPKSIAWARPRPKPLTSGEAHER